MADYGSVQSPKIIYRQLSTSSLFTSPRLFTGFSSKGCANEPESIPSPTSILKSPFWPEPITPKTPKQEHKSPFEKLDSRGLVDALIDEKSDSNVSRVNTRMVLFGSNLKVQVPCIVPPNESPKSPTDFGIKTRVSSHLGPFSPRLNSGTLSGLSPSEMERSEDYTCVISYGPNPRTTHIFDDCIVESCCGVVKLSESSRFSERAVSCYPSESFLSSCYGCKKSLGQGKDIYMYRGKKAFCSNECRYMEMMLEESLEPDDYVYVYGAR